MLAANAKASSSSLGSASGAPVSKGKAGCTVEIGRFRGDGQPRKPLANGVRLLIHTGTSADEGEPKSPQRSGELGHTSIAIDGIDRDRLYDDAIV